MVCDSCGHEYSDHRSVTQSMHFCFKCQKVEPFVTFSEKQQAADNSNPGAVLGKYFESA